MKRKIDITQAEVLGFKEASLMPSQIGWSCADASLYNLDEFVGFEHLLMCLIDFLVAMERSQCRSENLQQTCFSF